MQMLFTVQFFALTVLFFLKTVDAAADTRARVYFDDVGDIVVGQTVSLYIDIDTDDEKLGPFLFPDIAVDGIIILQPEQLGTSYSKTEKGQQIIGIRKKYAVIPKRSGELTIPAVTVSWSETPEKSIATEPVSFQVTVPPGAKNLARLIVGKNIEILQEIVPAETEIKQGDAITRTIRITAQDTLALTLPPAEFATIDGLTAYPETPQLSDNINRGQYSAQRIDRVVYIAETAGNVTVPEISYEIWDLPKKAIDIVTLPAVSYEVAKIANASLSAPYSNRIRRVLVNLIDALRTNLISILWILICVAGCGYIAYRYGQQAIDTIANYRRQYKRSEKYIFKRLRRRCGKLSPPALRNDIWAWLSVLCKKDGIFTLANVDGCITDIKNKAFLHTLLRAPYAASKNGDALTPSEIRTGIVNLRRDILQTFARHPSRSNAITLNPMTKKA
ncbi:BatD family protein [Sneathiella marina]|uniref:BatD family protein n=1 Tax=Sneathiella marina TaxID=2950108 RepID=A0ABY4VYV5_9PROT|nr:BatD family protein [Sneathiella marina]USG59806.1 BatD family protein [Sneathiella marina]